MTFQSSSNVTADTEYQYSDLPPNAVYTVDILPSVPGAVGNVGDHTLTSWIVQTTENGKYVIAVIVTFHALSAILAWELVIKQYIPLQCIQDTWLCVSG